MKFKPGNLIILKDNPFNGLLAEIYSISIYKDNIIRYCVIMEDYLKIYSNGVYISITENMIKNSILLEKKL